MSVRLTSMLVAKASTRPWGASAAAAAAAAAYRGLHTSAILQRRAGIHPPSYFVPHVCSNGAVVVSPTTIKPTQKWVFVQEDIFNTAPWEPSAAVVKDKGGQVARFNKQLEEHEFVVPTFDDK